MMNKSISLSGITVSYFGNHVLNGLNLELSSGRFYALLGRNGAGKSTLMRILVGQESPNEGSGNICGYKLFEEHAKINQIVGYVSETIDFPSGNLQDFFSFYSKVHSTWNQILFEKNVAQTGISLSKGFRELSRGQRMQIGLCAAIAIQPKVLILDEVTSVLDAKARVYFLNQVKELTSNGATAILATNIVSEAHHYADTYILLETGKIAFCETPAELSERFTRLRKPKGAEHEIFELSECAYVGINQDDSLAYIIPAHLKLQIPHEFVDPSRVTPQEAFIYYTREIR
jgi:ABC-type multidrug transport system ATPase subunit